MTSFTNIANTEIDQDSPVTQPLMTAMRDNPIAISEGATGAPVIAAGWHPYDSTAIDDGNDGLFYDQSVDGSMVVVTPDFADGYEYRLRFDGVISSGAASNWKIELYQATSASYSSRIDITGSVTAADALNGTVVIHQPRRSTNAHVVNSNYGSGTTSGAGGGVTSFQYHATAQKILRARISYSASGTQVSGGKIYLERRLDQTT